MQIYTEQKQDCSWCAYTENYDGAMDAGQQLIGEGNTKQDAINDLKLKLE